MKRKILFMAVSSLLFLSVNAQLKVDSNGNTIVRYGNFSQGNDGVLYLGDNNHYIKSIWGYGVTIGTYGAPDAITLQQSTGKVGIGTSSSTYGRLQINGTGVNNGLSVYKGSGTPINMIHNSDDNAYIMRGTNTNAGIRLLYNGHVGINGYASANYWLYVTGDCRANSWSTYSDSTAKTDIADISDAERIMELQPVSFKWKEVQEDRTHYGFLAQDVQQIFPDVVTSDERGQLAIEYDAFIPMLVDCY